MRSTTSASSSRLPKLKRTLKRKPTFRPFEESDIKYLYAAYKRGAFEAEEGLSPTEFKDHVTDFLLANYHDAWLLGDIGIIFGLQVGSRTLIGDMQWFPWATKRQISEHLIGFLNGLRRDTDYFLECDMENVDFFVYAAKHGIIRQAGTFYNPERKAIFESKRWVT